ncbi:S-ribosylhomocysteine lyase [Catenisphaera adipataccumulans]|jgi:S-ribosylhomocysteine lyase|uniref:S-ribosylhomocysteine lyase n=1 Tax=Catenisphaera adipataccumulans TaxID=700500 RepID=A0A7W8FVC2_9FIRM|nr:S-ribosylhomocysteine lyase [Catenisphaera adipataccumulans]MBB5182978.1 S-ribosylhomocysteine lyase [Catenisphaera adipataccumulans]
MKEHVEIESFTLDHTKVKAPYVRLIDTSKGPKGDVISNFDVRLTQPNVQAIPTAGMHTLEHILAMELRPKVEGYIDCSPFGCRTGFHLLTWGEHTPHEIALALKESLQDFVDHVEWEDVPGTKEKECGNYRDHSLFCAKEWAKQVLEQGISDDPYERKIV